MPNVKHDGEGTVQTTVRFPSSVWNRMKLSIVEESMNGTQMTQNDFILAAVIEKIMRSSAT